MDLELAHFLEAIEAALWHNRSVPAHRLRGERVAVVPKGSWYSHVGDVVVSLAMDHHETWAVASAEAMAGGAAGIVAHEMAQMLLAFRPSKHLEAQRQGARPSKHLEAPLLVD